MTQDKSNTPSQPAQLDAANVYLARLAHNFETSARRWELVVYPVLLSFIVLASYGFFLIYSLTNSVHDMKDDMHQYLSTMATDMQSMTTSVNTISKDMSSMTSDVDATMHKIAVMEPMLKNISAMKEALHHVALAVTYMRNDVGQMTSSIARSMNFVDGVMP